MQTSSPHSTDQRTEQIIAHISPVASPRSLVWLSPRPQQRKEKMINGIPLAVYFMG